MKFDRIIPEHSPKEKNGDDLIFIFTDTPIPSTRPGPRFGKGLVLLKNEGFEVPKREMFSVAGLKIEDEIVFAQSENSRLIAGIASGEDLSLEELDIYGLKAESMRTIAFLAGCEVFQAASLASQLLDWSREHRFCGSCGEPTQPNTTDMSLGCRPCGTKYYPRISPAVIVAVLKDNCILLAHNKMFPEGLYSLVAGFVEPGESLEETVTREVFEEVGVHLKNIRYFGSQSWPFPNSLMLGFTAEYDGGEITADGEEITDARFFTPEEVPKLPGSGAISRKIIDWFIHSRESHETAVS
jgi:NAD+ diphosphatase